MLKKKPTNMGGLALSKSGKSLSQIADLCGVSRSTCGHWRSGHAKPRQAGREVLFETMKIPVDAWDQPLEKPKNGGAHTRITPTKKFPAYPDPPENPSTLEHAQWSLACLRHDMKHRELTFSARMKLRAEESRALTALARIETAQELSEDRYVKNHPAWIALRGRIIAALAKHPDAAADVLKAIE